MPSTILHVRLRRDESGYPPFDSEELLSIEVGDHLYELVTVPTFARGLAKGDVVEARHYGDQARLWVERLDTPSGHSVVRVVRMGSTTFEDVSSACRVGGCVVAESAARGLVTIDVDVTADLLSLKEALLAGRGTGRWDFDVGVAAAGYEELLGW